MAQIVLDLQPQVADKFNTYIKLFGNEELMFDRFIDYHISRLKREITRMQSSLNKYEEKYNMKSDDFYRLFNEGKYGDEKDYMLWAGIYELQMNSKQKLEQLI
ncbi:MAG: hypothetical protein B6D61_01260 [Bacteroidetes bacterium 4484_249]|nr:MAG: hypothetical protein B6D61_01260 [Bacteroidetes bacterium 4484_249]